MSMVFNSAACNRRLGIKCNQLWERGVLGRDHKDGVRLTHFTQEDQRNSSKSMHRKLHPLTSLLTALTMVALAIGGSAQVQAADAKADPSGTWTWSTPGRD